MIDTRAARACLLAATSLLLPAATLSCRPATRPSVVLITIDTLRADRLGCYGATRPASPRIDALARQSTLFERATTTLPRTTQSIGSILTGRYPKTHGARGLFAVLPHINRTLAEVFKEAGYETAAIVSNTFLRPGQGFEQGFDLYDNPERRWDANTAEEITTAAIRWLDDGHDGGPFFLWVHYLDPHWRYEPPPPFNRAFDAGFTGKFTVYDDLAAGRLTKGQVIFTDVLTGPQMSHLTALYDGEVASTDAAVGRLLDRLDRLPRPPILLLTADHGESLGEHGYRFAHGEYLYESNLRIPLLIRHPPSVPAGLRTPVLAMNVDIAPTLLTLAGIDRLQGVEGRPLLVPGAGGGPGATLSVAPGHPFVFAESDFQLIHPENPRFHRPGPQGRWTSASDGRYKLIHIPLPHGEQLELYDLESDPGESRNLVGEPASQVAAARLLRALKEFADYGHGPGANSQAEPEGLTPEDLERLRSLGYIN